MSLTYGRTEPMNSTSVDSDGPMSRKKTRAPRFGTGGRVHGPPRSDEAWSPLNRIPWTSLISGVVVILTLTLWSAPAQAQAPDEEQPVQQTLEEVTAQGKLYLRRKRAKMALKFLDRAYKMAGGPNSFEVVYLMLYDV